MKLIKIADYFSNNFTIVDDNKSVDWNKFPYHISKSRCKVIGHIKRNKECL